METIQTSQFRGLNTGWIEWGRKENPILFMIHGYPDTPLVWECQARFFENRFQVVMPFVRGEGPSKASAFTSRYGTFSQTLDFLQMIREIDPMGKRLIYLVGHDLGAVHAWNLAPYLGNRLGGLVIFNGLHLLQMLAKLKSPRQHFRSWYIYGTQVPGLAKTMTRLFPKRISELAYTLGKLSPGQRPSFSADAVQSPVRQYGAFLREIPKMLKQGKTPLQAPVLVMWGESDPFVEGISSHEFREFASNVTFRLSKRGHWHFREDPSETNQILSAFFEEACHVGNA